MRKHYFKITDDVYIPKRWHLDDPVNQRGKEVNPWQFLKGHAVTPAGRLRIPIAQPGRPLDYTTTPLGTTPIVHARVAELLAKLAADDVQLLPVDIPSQPEQYFLVNTLRLIKCIDDARCEEVVYFKPEDGQPNKVGTYRNVAGMRIDPSKVGDAHMFRPWGWEITVVVSEDIKRGLKQLGATGPRFTKV